MRSVALFIILLNFLVFAWYQQFLPWLPWQPLGKIAYQPVPETKEIPKLILLSEKNSSSDAFDDTTVEDIFNETAAHEPKFELVTAEPVTPITDIADIATNTTTVTTVSNEKTTVDTVAPKPITDIAYTLWELGRIAEQEVKQTSKQVTQQLDHHTSAHFLADEGFTLKPTESIASLESNSVTTTQSNEADTSTTQVSTMSGLSLPEKTTVIPSFELLSPSDNQQGKEKLHVAVLLAPVTKTVGVKSTRSTQAENQAINNKKITDKESTQQTKPILTKKSQTNVISPPQPHFICYTTGIYQDKSLAQRVTTWFKAKSPAIAKINTQTSRKLVSTWVYLPPLKNRAEARRKEYALDNLGITTHHIIAKGAYKNALSLARFKNQKNVTNFLRWLKSKGLNSVKTQSNYHKKETYTVHIKLEKMASKRIIKIFKRHFKHQINQRSHCK